MIKSFLFTIMLAGCTIENVEFAHRSTLETRARGVGLHHSGSFAQVGMLDNTCEIQTSTGFIGTDLDVVTGQEDKVEDTFDSLALVVGASGDQLHILDRTDYSDYFIGARNVDQAKFYEDGVVILSDCNVAWVSDQTEGVSIDVPCGEGFAVDPIGNAYVGSPDGLAFVTPDGIETSDTSGSLLAFDPVLDVLYVADLGGSVISGLQNRTQIWSTDVGQPISSLDDMGIRGMVAVMVGDGEAGGIITLDGLSGQIVSTFPTPSTADSITVSGNGSVVAIVLPDEIHFYDIE